MQQMCAIERDEAGIPQDAKGRIDPALAVSGLCFTYSDGTRALSDVNLEVERGERLGVIGPNGAGKTTLFPTLCGILAPSAGQITILGKPVANRHFRPDVGLVFQNPDDQLFCPSVRDDVAFGLRNMGLPKDEVEARATQALSTVGCLELAGRPVHHLSEGEKRMVSIAGVLAMQPQLVIYDEPSAKPRHPLAPTPHPPAAGIERDDADRRPRPRTHT